MINFPKAYQYFSMLFSAMLMPVFLQIGLQFLFVPVQAQAPTKSNSVVVNYGGHALVIQSNADGGLAINVPNHLLEQCKKNGHVRYSDLGATGDGKTDDTDALVATHALANEQSLPVYADNGAIYYVGRKARPAVIATDTHFGHAAFIIDDTDVENHQTPVFLVASSKKAFALQHIDKLHRNQQQIKASLPGPCLITAVDNNVKHYIRYGLNQNNGDAQTDIFMVDKNGNVDMQSPIIWNFGHITSISALPIDGDTLHISGGTFTTIANRGRADNGYYSRNISIKRSNVVISNIIHSITGEGEKGSPYNGFIAISECANVLVKNATLTGHKTYSKIGNAGKPVAMGTYDITVNRALNVSIVNCRQTNDIDDKTYWGIMASNYSKNILYDSVVFSRFDAHKGVANATIRNSTLGHMGINAIGTGTLLIENCTIRSNAMVHLRSDYGSTWEGDFIIRNCTFIPAAGRPYNASLIAGSNSGKHNFGYPCYMPHTIIMENILIDDNNHPADYNGPAIFADFNAQMKDADYQETFPYIKTKQVLLQNVTTKSGRTLRLSNNNFMFRNVRVQRN